MLNLSPQPYRITTHDWHQMGNIFTAEQHLQLINGKITEMAPIGHKHAGHLKYLVHFFRQQLADNTVLSIQDPLLCNDFSEPEPDLMLLNPDAHFYKNRHPNASDVLLLIEVSDSTLQFDRTQKLELYAKQGINDYWIVNLNEQRLEVYRQPKADTYQQQQTLLAGEFIQPLKFPEISLAIADIF